MKKSFIIGISLFVLVVLVGCKSSNSATLTDTSEDFSTSLLPPRIEGYSNGNTLEADDNGTVHLPGTFHKNGILCIIATNTETNENSATFLQADENGKFNFEFTGIPPETTIKFEITTDIIKEDDSVSLNNNPKVDLTIYAVGKKGQKEITLGMSKEEVIDILGEPVADETDETGQEMLIFDDGTSYFLESERIVGGSTEDIMDQVSKQKKNTESSKKGFAISFGKKPTETLAERQFVYKAEQLDDTTMKYTWKTGVDEVGTLIRIDSAERMTKVYLYDEDAEDGLGEELYSGRTIFDKNN